MPVSRGVSLRMWCQFLVITGMLVGLFQITSTTASASEVPNADAILYAQEFITAVQSKDIDRIMEYVDVPWLMVGDGTIIKTRKELKQAWLEQLKYVDFSNTHAASADAKSYTDTRLETTQYLREFFPKEDRKRWNLSVQTVYGKEFDAVMKRTDLVITTYTNDPWPKAKFILVRRLQNELRVVGGPYGISHLGHGSRIPPVTHKALMKAESFELLSLDPFQEDEAGFHGRKLLGSTPIKDEEIRKKLIYALKQPSFDAEGVGGGGCFHPSHGIRTISGKRTVDLVICFGCGPVIIYDSAHVPKFEGDDTDGFSVFLGGRGPYDFFNQVLTDAKVPLPAMKTK